MDLPQMICHLENAVFALTTTELDPNKNFFSRLIAQAKSTANKKSSISLVMKMFDSQTMREINVHDLFALPGVNVAGHLYSNTSCNPRSFGYLQGTNDIVTLRSVTILTPQSSPSQSGNLRKNSLPPALPRIITKQDRAWEFLAQAIKDKKFTSVQETKLRTMITEQKSEVIDCCTASASYESIIIHWGAALGAQSLVPSSTSASSRNTIDFVSLALDLVSKAFQQKLITPEEKKQLYSLVSAGDKFIQGSVIKEYIPLEEKVDMWRAHLANKK